jgi:hypothetical protein
MTAKAPCTCIARSIRTAGDRAAVHAAACSASSHLVEVAQLRRVAALSTRSRLGGGMRGFSGTQGPASSWSTATVDTSREGLHSPSWRLAESFQHSGKRSELVRPTIHRARIGKRTPMPGFALPCPHPRAARASQPPAPNKLSEGGWEVKGWGQGRARKECEREEEKRRRRAMQS